MAYTVHRHHSQQRVSNRRVQHVLKSGGCAGPKKAKGGTVGSGGGQAEKKAEKALDAMHAKKDMHEAFKHGGHVMARGNDSAADMAPTSAEHGDVYVEGVRNSHRIPKKHGGGVRPAVVNIDSGRHVHIHLPHPGAGPMPGAGMPPGIAAAPPGVMAAPGPAMAGPAQGLPQGLPAGVAAPGVPVRKRGGHVRAGAMSGVGREQAFHEQKTKQR
jgi:hypothetical protein